ncbi:hypothetical protein L207DRAFT_582580 [Hyaloscypha variabilis F]|uniref:Heterokaryon incompatibility protein 6, OR allele n=1 Tax=Hyaloscypha variabilis (strain UAMH 11265 / GT02V1 / F) TaxID=1149755 RepID=A0A2J6RPE0_HYAVF|nr:hypothetical protein L207DRAFT_582580 [Hyaloscypha variabilis F]
MATSTGHKNPYGLLHDQQKAFRDTSVLGYFRRDEKLRSYRDAVLNSLLGWEKDSPLNQSQKGTTEMVTHGLVTGVSHRFFITKDGYMGKGKVWVRPGDIVCVLYGGSVPFVLRPVDAKYLFLGECYGIMDGEAVSMRSAGELQEQTFVLI